MSGQIPVRALISDVSNGIPCQVTTIDDHGLTTGDFVRITDLNGMIPILRGMDQINNKRYKIVVTDTDKFNLYHPVTNKPVDSTLYVPYIQGGRVDIIAHNFVYHGDE